jgi:hypothetical protein
LAGSMLEALLRRAVVACLFVTGGVAMAVEEPRFEVLKSEAPFEVRQYDAFVVAETVVPGGFDAASRSGFRRVAAFIFGDNTARDGQSRKIAMTAPVTVAPEGEGWRLHFVMPPGSELAKLPRPNDDGVRLREVPAHRMAAVRFSGFTTEESVARHTRLLRDWLQANAIDYVDAPQVARYNDPFTLPWNRRNEILMPLAGTEGARAK